MSGLPSNLFPLPSAGRSAADYERLYEAIDRVLASEVARIQTLGDAGPGRDLDRQALQAAFDENGFAGQYFGLDFSLPLAEFLPALEHVHQDQIVSHRMLAESNPNGMFDLANLVDIDLTKLGPND
jgi:hypothetical protein